MLFSLRRAAPGVARGGDIASDFFSRGCTALADTTALIRLRGTRLGCGFTRSSVLSHRYLQNLQCHLDLPAID